MLVYKVMHKHMHSISLRQIEYEVGKWRHTPKHMAKKGYYLTCFKSLDEARSFTCHKLACGNNYRIWECEARKIFLPRVSRLSYGSLDRLYDHLQFYTDPLWNWPKGTMMCKAIKLRKQICLN